VNCDTSVRKTGVITIICNLIEGVFFRIAASGAKRPFDVSQVLTVKSPGYSLCYLLVGHAIYPPTRHLAVKVRLFIDFLVERFSAGPKAGIGRSNAMDA